jgi:hypothetical protein
MVEGYDAALGDGTWATVSVLGNTREVVHLLEG